MKLYVEISSLSFIDKCNLEISCDWILNPIKRFKSQVFKNNDVAHICKMHPAAALVTTQNVLDTIEWREVPDWRTQIQSRI